MQFTSRPILNSLGSSMFFYNILYFIASTKTDWLTFWNAQMVFLSFLIPLLPMVLAAGGTKWSLAYSSKVWGCAGISKSSSCNAECAEAMIFSASSFDCLSNCAYGFQKQGVNTLPTILVYTQCSQWSFHVCVFT